jgi:hypothetical protein
MYSRKLQILCTAYIHTLELSSEPIRHTLAISSSSLPHSEASAVDLRGFCCLGNGQWAMGNAPALQSSLCRPCSCRRSHSSEILRIWASREIPRETPRETLLPGFLGFRKGCVRCKSPTSPRGLTMFCAVLEMALTMRILRSIYYDDGPRAWSPMFQTRQSNPED